MNTISTIEFKEIKKKISLFDIDKKIELIETLEKETFPKRFKAFLNKIKTDDISIEEITSEVELIREKRFNAKKKN